MLVYSGYEKVEYDRKDGTHIEGYNLFLLEQLEEEDGKNKGYRPYQIFNRNSNRMVFPWLSVQRFQKLGLSSLRPMSVVDVGLNFDSIRVIKEPK